LIRPGCFFLPVPSIFYYYLGGNKMVDSTWASVSQLMDAKARKWSREILRALEIPIEVMPVIVPPGTAAGDLSEPLAGKLGLNRARLVAVASHDTASAFAAAPVSSPEECLIVSSGTWSLIGKLIPEPITSPEAMAASVSNEGGIGNIRFLKNCMGTWLVQELRRAWRVADGREAGWDELNNLTAASPALRILINPDDPGFYNPENMEEAIAAFCRRTSQPVPADRGQYLRVIYESLALKYRQVNEQICSLCGTRTRQVNIVGGGCRNERLNQFVANALGLPVMTGPEEATAVGNFMVQALGMGIVSSLDEAHAIVRSACSIKEYRPTEKEKWDEAYARFLKIL
jgi:sugar (pentulose or hexulose) kinase